jgi:hypothetical protein
MQASKQRQHAVGGRRYRSARHDYYPSVESSTPSPIGFQLAVAEYSRPIFSYRLALLLPPGGWSGGGYVSSYKYRDYLRADLDVPLHSIHENYLVENPDFCILTQVHNVRSTRIRGRQQ